MDSGCLRRSVRWLLEAIFLVVSLVSVKASQAQNPSGSLLRVRVYNYARVDSESLTSSERTTDRIFRNAGVRIEWLDCPLSAATESLYPACPSDIPTNEFVLRILPRSMAAKLPASSDSLGFAYPCAQTERACPLTVFYDRIEQLAVRGYRGDRILGYAIAHELAHVLIGPGHSEEGIMRGEWSAQELQRISWGLHMDFNLDERNQLQAAVQKRSARSDEQTNVARR